MNSFKKILISIIVPVFDEATILIPFHQRLKIILEQIKEVKDKEDFEIIYVNDGSLDDSLEVLHQIKNEDRSVSIINLSRNFGKEAAMTAGLDYCLGDAAIVMDADGQDPPELIPILIQNWQKGYDVVYAKRTSREGESWLKKTSAHLFYRAMQALSSCKIPLDTGDFRLLSRRAIEALKKLPEKHRFMKGLFAWIGYPQIAVPYERPARIGGASKWNYWKLWNFAIEGMTSFSIGPLKCATYLGFLTATSAFIYALVIITKTLVYGEPVQGYPSLMVVILSLGGIQLISLGIIGEYLGRTFNESKQRPLYFVEDYCLANALESRAIKKSTTSNTPFSLPTMVAVTK